MCRVITVTAVNEGWALRNGDADPLLFETPAHAVWSARKLGETLAEGGVETEIHVIQRDGGLAGRYLCPSNPSPLAEGRGRGPTR